MKMMRMNPPTVLALIQKNRQGVKEVEEHAKRFYKEAPAHELAIAEAWIKATIHVLDQYYVGVYPMTISDVQERMNEENKEGFLGLSYGNNIVKFPSKRSK